MLGASIQTTALPAERSVGRLMSGSGGSRASGSSSDAAPSSSGHQPRRRGPGCLTCLVLVLALLLQLGSLAAACGAGGHHHAHDGDGGGSTAAAAAAAAAAAPDAPPPIGDAPTEPDVLQYEEVDHDSFLSTHRRRLMAAAGPPPALLRETPGPRCGSRHTSALEQGQVAWELARADFTKKIAAARLPGRMSIASAYDAQGSGGLSVNLYFHVVSGTSINTSVEAPPELLAAQVDIMNAAYGPQNIRFRLRGVTRVVSEPWALTEINTGTESAMKNKLHRGGASDLNIYLIRPASGTLGWSTFPWELSKLGMPFDGVVAHIGTMPGGSMHPYNKGFTIVHETGHWLGLLHVFENGCSGVGDSVDDTPPQASAAYGCPLERDTCPQPGRDPVTNYMGYTDDACMTHFTPGQGQRILKMWEAYRGTLDNAAESAAAYSPMTSREMASAQAGSGMSQPINPAFFTGADPAAAAAAAAAAQAAAKPPRPAPAQARPVGTVRAPIVRRPVAPTPMVVTGTDAAAVAAAVQVASGGSKNTGRPPRSSSAPRPPPAYIQSRPATGVADMQATLLAAMGSTPTSSSRAPVTAASHVAMASAPAAVEEAGTQHAPSKAQKGSKSGSGSTGKASKAGQAVKATKASTKATKASQKTSKASAKAAKAVSKAKAVPTHTKAVKSKRQAGAKKAGAAAARLDGKQIAA